MSFAGQFRQNRFQGVSTSDQYYVRRVCIWWTDTNTPYIRARISSAHASRSLINQQHVHKLATSSRIVNLEYIYENTSTSGLHRKAEEKLEWAFQMYDIDGNGTIDQNEMIEIIRVRCPITLSRICSRTRTFDSARISPHQCASVVVQRRLARCAQAIYSMLGADQDGSGGEMSPEMRTEEIFRKMDTNGDGVLSKACMLLYSYSLHYTHVSTHACITSRLIASQLTPPPRVILETLSTVWVITVKQSYFAYFPAPKSHSQLLIPGSPSSISWMIGEE